MASNRLYTDIKLHTWVDTFGLQVIDMSDSTGLVYSLTALPAYYIIFKGAVITRGYFTELKFSFARAKFHLLGIPLD
jgi:hypothetical protein